MDCVTFSAYFERYLLDLNAEVARGNKAPSYVSLIARTYLSYLLPFFSEKKVTDITSLDIRSFYNQLPTFLSIGTVKRILAVLRAYLTYLLRYDIITRRLYFPALALTQSPPLALTRAEQYQILQYIPKSHRPIFSFLMHQGLRISEARALQVRDITMSSNSVLVRRTFSDSKIRETTKANTIKTRLIHPAVREMLYTLCRAKFPAEYVFTVKNKPYSRSRLQVLFALAKKKAGIEEGFEKFKDINLYEATRHSVATIAITERVPVEVLRDYLGHTDIKTTLRYVHLLTDAQSAIWDTSTSTNK